MPGPEDERETVESVEKFLEGKDPISLWNKEKETDGYKKADGYVQITKDTLRKRRRDAAREDKEIEVVEDLQTSNHDKYYAAAIELAQALSTALDEPYALTGQALPRSQRPEYYNPEDQADNPYSNQEIQHILNQVNSREVGKIDAGGHPNEAQAFLSECIVNAMNKLGWPGDEVAEVLKKHNLYYRDEQTS